jgi:hypothetical protein
VSSDDAVPASGDWPSRGISLSISLGVIGSPPAEGVAPLNVDSLPGPGLAPVAGG